MVNIPVFGFVGRLSHQKGIDLFLAALEDMEQRNVQIVVLGVGDPQYHQLFTEQQKKNPDRLAALFQFDEKLAHQIYAGSDFLLMPSVFEPCGLNQMISLRYGTIPVVSRVGGLADTVTPWKDDGNGFVLEDYTVEGFLTAIDEAVDCYRQPERFAALARQAFTFDFSWDRSAVEYIKIYNSLLER